MNRKFGCQSIRQGFAAVAILLAVSAFGTTTAVAGTILVTGDSNTTDALGTAGNEQLFFSNVLGGGTQVRVLDFTGSFGLASDTDTEINDYYNSLGGVTSTLVAGAVNAATFAGVDLFVAALPDDNFSAGEVAAISDFLGSGGTLFLLGENDNGAFATARGSINQLLDDLGSGIDMVSGAFSGPGTFAADPFTAGLTDLRYAAGSQVTGGTTLFSDLAGNPLIARENTLVVSVPEPATVAIFGLALAGLGLARRRKQVG